MGQKSWISASPGWRMTCRQRPRPRPILTLPPRLAPTHGLVQHRYHWNWPAAAKEFQRALAIDSDLTMAHQMNGFSLVLQSKMDAGIDQLQQALGRDPKSARIHIDLALAHMYRRKWRWSEREIRAALDNDPKYFPAL
jgi:tetratricopeptide (TPR) repeat protein